MNVKRRASTGTSRPPRVVGCDVSELQRTAISQPMGVTPLTGYTVIKPVDLRGERIQVTAFYDELGRTVERWQFTETDVRWYHVEKVVKKRISVTVERQVPIG